MRIHIEIECSPQEARQFIGLPDVAPLNDALMKAVEERMMSAVGSLDPEAMLRRWVPGSMDAWQKLMRVFTGPAASDPAQRSRDKADEE